MRGLVNLPDSERKYSMSRLLSVSPSTADTVSTAVPGGRFSSVLAEFQKEPPVKWGGVSCASRIFTRSFCSELNGG